MDDLFKKKYGCMFPLLTNKANETQCILENSHHHTYLSVKYQYFRDFCITPCEKMRVQFAGHDNMDPNGNDNEGYVKFYIKDEIEIKKSRYSYTEVSLLAEVGGYVGLLLGASLMDIASLLDKLFVIIKQKFSG